MTRTEHLNWAKERALEHVNKGDIKAAIASITSDIKKFPHFYDNDAYLVFFGDTYKMATRKAPEVRRWIEKLH